jgi:hypothetical protein
MYCRTDRNSIAKNFFNPLIGVVSKSSKTEYFCGGCLTFVKVAHASDYQYGGAWKAKKN